MTTTKQEPKQPPLTAPEFLNQAADIMAARAAQYDQPGGERSMGKCVQAFNAITGHDLSEASGWLLLQLLKDVRQWQTPGKFHRDSVEDGVAYSALKAEALARGEAVAPAPSESPLVLPDYCPDGPKCDWQYFGRLLSGKNRLRCCSCAAERDVEP